MAEPSPRDTIGPASVDEFELSVSPPKDDTTAAPARVFRKASKSFSQSRPPVGMFAAYGHYASAVPALEDIQSGNFGPKGWSGPGQRRNSRAHRPTDFDLLHMHALKKKKATTDMKTGKVDIEKKDIEKKDIEKKDTETASQEAATVLELAHHDPSIPYANGYQFPPKHTKWQATKIGARGFWNYFITPVGFLITIYSLNVVAWGGMLFLILCHATPAMAHPSWNDNYSSAKIWLETDSQILNALFCVTGLGLIPWRFRDLYYLLQWRWRRRIPTGFDV